MNKITLLSRLAASSLAILMGLTACSTMPGESQPTILSTAKDGPPPFPVEVSGLKDAVPKYEPKSTYGNPKMYTAIGKHYYVMDSAKGYSKVGIASWYGTQFHNKPTSSREPYDMLAMTAASPTLPIPTYVRVTNLENGRQIVVRVNDRGPFANDRIMDLSYAAAKKLGYADKGTAKVKVEAITFDQPNDPFILLAKNTVPNAKQLYLQVGAFNQITKAQQVKIKVAQLTHQSARIQTVMMNDKAIYRVQVGPLRELQKPDIVDCLQQQGFNKPIVIFS